MHDKQIALLQGKKANDWRAYSISSLANTSFDHRQVFPQSVLKNAEDIYNWIQKSSICSVDPNANFHWHHLLLLRYSTPQLVYWINVHKDRVKRQNLGWYNDSDVLFGWGFAVQWTPCTVYCSIHILACSFSKNIKPIMPLDTVGIR